MSCADLFLAFIAILFPPIAVWIKSGICTADSLINIALCMLGYVPGLLHAWYIIACNPEHDYDYEPIGGDRRDPERQGGERVTYYYVSHNAGGRQPQRQYGSTGPQQPGHVQQGKPGARQPGFQQQQQQQQQESGVVPSGSAAGPSQGAGDEGAAPPPYAEAVRGDHKVQTSD